MGNISTIEYYLTIRRNEILIHATAWMNLENTVVSERSQTQKNHILYNFIYVMLRLGKSVETKCRVSGCLGQRGWEDREVIAKGMTYTYP